jgi:hypothetical protein
MENSLYPAGALGKRRCDGCGTEKLAWPEKVVYGSDEKRVYGRSEKEGVR